jgi:hypothetical protein
MSCAEAVHGLDAPPAAHSAAEMRQIAQHARRSTSTIFGSDIGAAASTSDNRHRTSNRSQRGSAKRSVSAHPSQSQRGHAPGDLRRSPSPNPTLHTAPDTAHQFEYRSGLDNSDHMHKRNMSHNPVNRQKSYTSHNDSYIDSKLTQQTPYTHAKIPGVSTAEPQASGDSSAHIAKPLNTVHSSFQGQSGSDRPYIDGLTAVVLQDSRSSWQNGDENARAQRSHAYVANQPFSRPRSKSFAGTNKTQKHYTKDGQEILAIVIALYDYQATIQEEIGFQQGDTLAIIEMREDGWWLGEIIGAQRLRRGLVPSNFFRRAH